ncbi:MAG: hypothetical protein MHMPM18_000491 [Marteilia pararefringens]
MPRMPRSKPLYSKKKSLMVQLRAAATASREANQAAAKETNHAAAKEANHAAAAKEANHAAAAKEANQAAAKEANQAAAAKEANQAAVETETEVTRKAIDLTQMKATELKILAKTKNLSTGGRKKEILTRITEKFTEENIDFNTLKFIFDGDFCTEVSNDLPITDLNPSISDSLQNSEHTNSLSNSMITCELQDDEIATNTADRIGGHDGSILGIDSKEDNKITEGQDQLIQTSIDDTLKEDNVAEINNESTMISLLETNDHPDDLNRPQSGEVSPKNSTELGNIGASDLPAESESLKSKDSSMLVEKRIKEMDDMFEKNKDSFVWFVSIPSDLYLNELVCICTKIGKVRKSKILHNRVSNIPEKRSAFVLMDKPEDAKLLVKHFEKELQLESGKKYKFTCEFGTREIFDLAKSMIRNSRSKTSLLKDSRPSSPMRYEKKVKSHSDNLSLAQNSKHYGYHGDKSNHVSKSKNYNYKKNKQDYYNHASYRPRDRDFSTYNDHNGYKQQKYNRPYERNQNFPIKNFDHNNTGGFSQSGSNYNMSYDQPQHERYHSHHGERHPQPLKNSRNQHPQHLLDNPHPNFPQKFNQSAYPSPGDRDGWKHQNFAVSQERDMRSSSNSATRSFERHDDSFDRGQNIGNRRLSWNGNQWNNNSQDLYERSNSFDSSNRAYKPLSPQGTSNAQRYNLNNTYPKNREYSYDNSNRAGPSVQSYGSNSHENNDSFRNMNVGKNNDPRIGNQNYNASSYTSPNFSSRYHNFQNADKNFETTNKNYNIRPSNDFNNEMANPFELLNNNTFAKLKKEIDTLKFPSGQVGSKDTNTSYYQNPLKNAVSNGQPGAYSGYRYEVPSFKPGGNVMNQSRDQYTPNNGYSFSNYQPKSYTHNQGKFDENAAGTNNKNGYNPMSKNFYGNR